MDEGIAVVVGRALRTARRSRGFTLREVGTRSDGDLKPTAVAGYERGERSVSIERFFGLCRLYAIAPERLVAEIARIVDGRAPIVVDQEQIERLSSTEALLVADFLHEVRGLRGTPQGDAVTLRAGDVEVLATASGLRTEKFLDTIGPALRPDRSIDRVNG